VIKYLVVNGHPNFRLGLLKKSSGIQEATSKFHKNLIVKIYKYRN